MVRPSMDALQFISHRECQPNNLSFQQVCDNLWKSKGNIYMSNEENDGLPEISIGSDQAKILLQTLVMTSQFMACVQMLYNNTNPWIEIPAIAQMHGMGMAGGQLIPKLKTARVAKFLRELADAVEEAGDIELQMGR